MGRDRTGCRARGRGGPCLDPNCACCAQGERLYVEVAREMEAEFNRSAKVITELGADAATMEKLRSIKSAIDSEKERYRKMTGRTI